MDFFISNPVVITASRLLGVAQKPSLAFAERTLLLSSIDSISIEREIVLLLSNARPSIGQIFPIKSR